MDSLKTLPAVLKAALLVGSECLTSVYPRPNKDRQNPEGKHEEHALD